VKVRAAASFEDIDASVLATIRAAEPEPPRVNPCAPWRQTSAGSFVGIDPGLHGFAAEIGRDGGIRLTRVPVIDVGGKLSYDLPGMVALARTWSGSATVALIEQQGPMPGNGAVGNFAVGFGWGLWRMALTAADVPVEVITPLKWKTAMGIAIPRSKPVPKAKERLTKAEKKAAAKAQRLRLDGRRKDGDRRAIECAQAMFPSLNLRATRTGEKLSADKACAALLAALARRQRGRVG